MSKNRRKSDTCLNCKFALRPEDNYCPNCGQENNTNKIPVQHLIFEVFEDFFHFDAKLWNTLKASFSKPGRITVEYLEGKRVSYVPPVKFYVFVSFVFFLLLGKLSDHAVDTGSKSFKKGNMQTQSLNISLNELLGNKKSYYSKDSNDVRMIDFEFESKDSLKEEIKKLKSANNSVLNDLLLKEEIDTTPDNRERLRTALSLIPDNTITIDTIKKAYKVYGKVKFNSQEEYNQFKEDVKYFSDDQIDSVLVAKGEKANWFNRQMLKKQARFDFNSRDDVKQIIHAILKSISLTMFIMMPLTAILLLLIFYRKKYYYEHLIFSIHIHTIYFLIFSLVLTIQVFISEKVGEKMWGWAFLLCLVYLLMSLKNNYKQTWGKTIAKFMLMSIPYFLVSLVLFILAIIYGYLA